jgi:hypothetical protein
MPAVLRFGGFILALGACWTATPTPLGIPPQAPVETTPDLSGSYWCSIDEDGYEYPKYPCMIKKVDGELVLAKLSGSQRIRGLVKPNARDGFSFSGEMYCPDGDCQQELHGSFKAVRGGFRGKFREESLVVHLTPATASAFGGADYGSEDAFNLDGIGDGPEHYQIDSRGRRRP